MTKSGDEAPDNARAAHEEALRELARAGAGRIDIAGGALALAALDRPRVDLARYRHHLAALAEDVRAAAQTSRSGVGDLVAALSGVIAGKHGYAGDMLTYDDLQNANIMRVIDRRRGLPVALGILYIHAARAQGWDIAGLAFPGHFLLRLQHSGERAVLDPFNGGCARATAELRDLLKTVAGETAELAPEHYAPVADRDILLRLVNNMKLRLIRANEIEKASAVVDRMLLFAGDQPMLWLEAGTLRAQAGNLKAAAAALETCIDRADSASLRHRAASLLQQLRSRIN